MPIKFSETTADLPNTDQTIIPQKTFKETIIGDISSSNNTSYFTDICVNQISDIAGQVLTIDCSLNVKGNISYKDAGGNQQDLLAIIADLSGKITDLSNTVDDGVPVTLTMQAINAAVSGEQIAPTLITCSGDIYCQTIYSRNHPIQVGTGAVVDGSTHIINHHYQYSTNGYEGLLRNFHVRYYGLERTYGYDHYAHNLLKSSYGTTDHFIKRYYRRTYNGPDDDD